MRVLVRILCLAGIVAAVSSLPVFADRSPRAEKRSERDGDRIAIGDATVEIDRRTGRMRKPAADEAAKLRRAMQQMFQATREHSQAATVGPQGIDNLVLDERHAVFSIARIDGEGRVSTVCITGAAEAESHMVEGASRGAEHEE